MSLCYSLCCCSKGVTKTQSEFIERTGVIAHQEGSARILSALWTVVVVMDKPSPPNVRYLLDRYEEYRRRAEQFVSEGGVQVWDAQLRVIKGKLLATTQMPRGRQRRGAIDIIGHVGKALFGLATVDDLNTVITTVNSLGTAINSLSMDADRMITVMNATQETLHALQVNMDVVGKRTTELYGIIRKIKVHLRDHIRAIQELQIKNLIQEIIDLLQLAADSYTEGILAYRNLMTQMDHGLLTRDILPEDELYRIMSTLRTQGHSVLPMSWYYKHLYIDPLWDSETQLAYQIVIPVVSHEECLSYSLLYVPVMLSENMTRTIQGADHLVLSTESNTAFAPEPTSCMGTSPIVCYPSLQIVSRQCETGIVQGKGVKDCSFVIGHSPNKHSMAYRSMKSPFNIVVVPFSPVGSYVIVRCPGRGPVREKVVNVTIFHLDNGCGIEGVDWRIAGVKLGSTRVNMSFVRPLEFAQFELDWPDQLPEVVLDELRWQPTITMPYPNEGVRALDVLMQKRRVRVPMVTPWSVSGVGLGIGSILMVIGVVAVYYVLVYRKRIKKVLYGVRDTALEAIDDIKRGDKGINEGGGLALSGASGKIPPATVKHVIKP